MERMGRFVAIGGDMWVLAVFYGVWIDLGGEK